MDKATFWNWEGHGLYVAFFRLLARYNARSVARVKRKFSLVIPHERGSFPPQRI